MVFNIASLVVAEATVITHKHTDTAEIRLTAHLFGITPERSNKQTNKQTRNRKHRRAAAKAAACAKP